MMAVDSVPKCNSMPFLRVKVSSAFSTLDSMYFNGQYCLMVALALF